MSKCYIGLGSNLGNRQENIKLAVDKIGKLKKTEIKRMSSVIETLPVGGPPQPKFLNAVIEIATELAPKELLFSLQRIESELGRARTVRNAPRTIDLDILFFDDMKMNDKDLILPHPRIKEREFVLTPLREIAGEALKLLLNEDN